MKTLLRFSVDEVRKTLCETVSFTTEPRRKERVRWRESRCLFFLSPLPFLLCVIYSLIAIFHSHSYISFTFSALFFRLSSSPCNFSFLADYAFCLYSNVPFLPDLLFSVLFFRSLCLCSLPVSSDVSCSSSPSTSLLP